MVPQIRISRLSFCLLPLLAGAALLGAQAPEPTQRPTFQVSVNYVDVDVTVTDAEGNFVTGLTPDDFQVAEDGRPQKIETFSYIELPLARPDAFQFLGRPVPADVRSNRDVSSGRVYIIVLDDLNVAPLRTTLVRKSAREFIERHFGLRDLAAVVTTSGRKDAAQEFTNDPTLLLRAIDSFIGQRLQSAELQRIDNYYQSQLLSGLDAGAQTGQDPSQQATVPNLLTRIQPFDSSDLERGQRAVGVLNTMRSLAEFLEGVRGRRKALLWFSEGIDYPMAEAFSSHSGSEITRATQEAISAAARANVNFFALDPRGLIGLTTDFIDIARSGGPDYAGTDPTKPFGTPFSGTQALLGEMRLTQDSLRTLAEGTGGFAAVDTNSFAETFERITEANSRYYLIGYTPPTHPRDGRFHRIEVTVKRPGLKAVARRGYPSLSGRTRDERRQEALDRWARERRDGGANDTSTELRFALNSPVQQPGLTLSVQAVPFKAGAREASVALAVELQGSELEFAQQPNGLFADTLEISFFALNDDGRAQRGTRAALNLAVRPETYQRIKALGIRANSRAMLPTGRYQLRVGARDPLTGKTGTVFYDVLVPDFTKEPLMMSGLLISSLSAGPAGGTTDVFTAQRDPIAEKMLGAAPTPRREFRQDETLVWLTEIYDNTRAPQARKIEVSARLIEASGREAFAARDVLSNGEGGATKWTAFAHAGRIPLKDLAPGRYLLRIDAHDRTDASAARAVVAETVITIGPT